MCTPSRRPAKPAPAPPPPPPQDYPLLKIGDGGEAGKNTAAKRRRGKADLYIPLGSSTGTSGVGVPQ